MASRSRSRKLSFDILNTATETSLIQEEEEEAERDDRLLLSEDSILDDPRPAVTENGSCRTEPEANCDSHSVESVNVCEPEESVGTVRPVREATDFLSVRDFEGRELRQRSVAGGGSEGAVSRIDEEDTEESGCTEVDSVSAKQRAEPNGNAVRRLETAGSFGRSQVASRGGAYGGRRCLPMQLDISWGYGGLAWVHPLELAKELTIIIVFPVHDDEFGATILLPDVLSVEKSPWNYFMEELYSGNSLRNTTTLGNDKERERVYDTMFRLPWRCELVILVLSFWEIRSLTIFVWSYEHSFLIDVGLFVCLDSFLSLLTIMPARILMTFGKLFKTGNVVFLLDGDFECCLCSCCFSFLPAFVLCCFSFGLRVLRSFLVAGVIYKVIYHTCARQFEKPSAAELSDFGCFMVLACGVALLEQTDISLIYHMIRGQGTIKLYVVYNVLEVTQNILEAEGPWFESFVSVSSLGNPGHYSRKNALVVYICEMMIDIIKHCFIAKFNDIKPIVYSEFLEDLCKQTLNMETENGKKTLTFVPLAPACVVIRVLAPVYAAHLPYSPLPWRLFWILLLSAMTFVMLASLKVMIGMGLKKHAKWYVNRCQKRKLHSD
ncbi:hypothetical protein C3L33_17238, partial [Rhododendron williamsianum]